MPFLLSAKDAWLKYFLDCSSVCRGLGWEEGVSVQAPGVVTRDQDAREQGYDPLYAHIASCDEVYGLVQGCTLPSPVHIWAPSPSSWPKHKGKQ